MDQSHPPNVTIEEAQAHLREIIARLGPGDEMVITSGDRPVAKITASESTPIRPRIPGSAKGILEVLADDDEHLKDFRDYMA